MTVPLTERRAALVLKDGRRFEGISFGAEHSVAGEAVFQTGMAGYNEGITDPSYEGQILVLTYPLIGNYGVPSKETDYTGLPRHFESDRIHVAGLVVADYSFQYSHWEAVEALGDWLKREGIPAIYAVDTREITTVVRDEGAMLGKILFQDAATGADAEVDWHDPNKDHLVAQVSRKEPQVFAPAPGTAIGVRILAVDVGMKYNQIRCFTNRGVELKVVPWDYDFTKEADAVDGFFFSNGPGDPAVCTTTIEHLRTLLGTSSKPIFGICLGHQLMALASGAQTMKLKFGNRGHNIPCVDRRSGRCYITCQNHGFAVDPATLQPGWEELFTNANDGTNEGITHTEKPFFSVQFHPESTPGPRDTEYLFDYFIANVRACKEAGALLELPRPVALPTDRRVHVNKVLVLGSGGLSIGQAGEFDYSGSQAIKALKEEGIYTVLINPNIATIQTSKGLADKCYFLPVTPEYVLSVIEHEKPDGILLTFGGQTALNCGIKIRHDLERLGVRVLGTQVETIMDTEDREVFANRMASIGEHCARSAAAVNLGEAIKAANEIGYPVIVRAAFALGGLGSGFANNDEEITELCNKAFATSPQVLVERSMKGWKEIEYEVVRDVNDNCITVCNMENFDPLGIHTGESIVVAPSQTLSDQEYHMLRNTAIKVIRHLGVVGECNIQYALNPDSREYRIIEVNARLSRSSALASKATGYPLAFVAAKLALNIPLTDIKNSVTRETSACFEPSLDYCVVKIPRWDLKKFTRVSKLIGSQMKSVGEVMSIGRGFEEALQKAIRSVNDSLNGFDPEIFPADEDVEAELSRPTDQRLFALARAFAKGYSVEQVWALTKIDRWFLHKLLNIHNKTDALRLQSLQSLPPAQLIEAKRLGFSDRMIAVLTKSSELAVRQARLTHGFLPVVKQIDTVAAEFPAHTNYLYLTYNGSADDVRFEDQGVLVLGSGVYRIGSSVEFDWCAVRCIRTCRENGLKTIMLNYNPETVSTDYDEADRLYFENITLENVLDIYERESSQGVVLSMGGQIPNNIAMPLLRSNVKIYGTSPVQIDNAENRFKFSRLLDTLGVDQPKWKELTSFEDALEFCDRVGFPTLVRPSYVLSGAAMNVVYTPDDLQSYLSEAVKVSREFPVVISKFIMEAKEIEVDAVAKDGKLVMHVVSEHIENAGVHSGDATIVQPAQDLSDLTLARLEAATAKIADALNVTGPFNIQYIAKDNLIKVIECNLRASRSFPFHSKVVGVDMIEMATKAMLGLPFTPYPNAKQPAPKHCAIKVPQFSFARLQGADPILGVEMASTGEVACFGRDKYEAYLKSLISTGFKMPKGRNVLISVGPYKEKMEMLPTVRRLHELGYKVFGTPGTADFYSEHDIPIVFVDLMDEGAAAAGGATPPAVGSSSDISVSNYLTNNLIDLYICLPSKNRYRRPASYMSRGYVTRRLAVDSQVPLITNVKIAKLFVEAMSRYPDPASLPIAPYDCISSARIVRVPGLVNVSFGLTRASTAADVSARTGQALAGGFTSVCVAHAARGSRGGELALRKITAANARCDFAFFEGLAEGAGAGGEAVAGLEVWAGDLSDMGRLMALFSAAPASLPLIVAGAAAGSGSSQLAALLYLGNLFRRRVHVTQVQCAEDLALIRAAKERHAGAGAGAARVTCDINPMLLFAEPAAANATTAAMWENLDVIDCFATGVDGGSKETDVSALTLVLPLLLTAAHAGRLAVADIVARMYTNPMAILGLASQPDSHVELDLDRHWTLPTSAPGPLAGAPVTGCVRRVVVRGRIAFVDGKVCTDPGFGLDVKSAQWRASSAAGRLEAAAGAGGMKRSDSAGSLASLKGAAPAVEVAAGALNASTASADELLGQQQQQQQPQQQQQLQQPPQQQQPPRSPQRKAAAVAAACAAAAPLALALDSATGAGGEERRSSAKDAVFDHQKFPSFNAAVAARGAHDMPSYLKHVLSVNQVSRADLHNMFGVAQELRTMVERMGSVNILKGKILVTAFFEPSTRTNCSFQAAMRRLGGSVIDLDLKNSSVTKGESLEDTVRCLECYGDALVMRHPTPGTSTRAAKVSKIPVINAGDGTGEHPTQAFLDLFTVREELGTINGLTITIVGDLKHGRTCHSLVKLLCLYNVTLQYVSSEALAMPGEIVEEATARGIRQTEFRHLDEALPTSDVIYVTRIQKERFASEEEYERVKGEFVITPKSLTHAKSACIVMHPLPRVDEISPEVDFDPRAAYFRQMKYGLYVRMALLTMLLDARR